eukprot:gene7777-639_t
MTTPTRLVSHSNSHSYIKTHTKQPVSITLTFRHHQQQRDNELGKALLEETMMMVRGMQCLSRVCSGTALTAAASTAAIALTRATTSHGPRMTSPFTGDYFAPSFDQIVAPPLLEKFVCCLMFDGKKTVAEKVLRNSLNKIKCSELARLRKEKADSLRNVNPDADVQKVLYDEAEYVDPMDIFKEAVSNCMPTIALTPMRKGASVYQVPTPLNPKRRQTLAIKWLINAARARRGKPIADRLAAEIMDAYQHQKQIEHMPR